MSSAQSSAICTGAARTAAARSPGAAVEKPYPGSDGTTTSRSGASREATSRSSRNEPGHPCVSTIGKRPFPAPEKCT